MTRMVVVLPAPFGPRNPNSAPSATESDTRSTPRLRPYRRVRLWSWISDTLKPVSKMNAWREINLQDSRHILNLPKDDGYPQDSPMTSDGAEPVAISVDEARSVSGLLQAAPGARACLVLANGAGAGMTHPFMAAIANGLAERRMDKLVALHAAAAGEFCEDDERLEMLAVDRHLDVLAGEPGRDPLLDAFRRNHQCLSL